jgi:N-acetylmuramoyl-L-alanine amidase
MKIKLRILLLCILALIIGAIAPSEWTLQPKAEAFGKVILKVGSKGGDVFELQGRLKYLGYYKGKIDGHFGWVHTSP